MSYRWTTVRRPKIGCRAGGRNSAGAGSGRALAWGLPHAPKKERKKEREREREREKKNKKKWRRGDSQGTPQKALRGDSTDMPKRPAGHQAGGPKT